MAAQRIEHLGIAVRDLQHANALFEKLLGTPPYKEEAVENEKVVTSFFKTGENKIELVASTSDDGPVGKFLAAKGEGIHHVAFEVDDIVAEMKRLRDAGFKLLNEEPKRGADNKMVCFVHPKTASGVLVELCQEIRG